MAKHIVVLALFFLRYIQIKCWLLKPYNYEKEMDELSCCAGDVINATITRN